MLSAPALKKELHELRIFLFFLSLVTSEGLTYDYEPQIRCQARHLIRK